MTEYKKVFILAKTYPQPSKKYLGLVCTAGILDDGTWIRLYPINFRQLENNQKYKKYTWIKVEVDKNTSDPRIESYRPLRSSIMVDKENVFHKVNGRENWEARKRVIFDKQRIYTNLRELIKEAYTTGKSLAIFKPTEIISLEVKPCSREWEKNKIEFIEAQRRQLKIHITQEEINYEMELVKKYRINFNTNL